MMSQQNVSFTQTESRRGDVTPPGGGVVSRYETFKVCPSLCPSDITSGRVHLDVRRIDRQRLPQSTGWAQVESLLLPERRKSSGIDFGDLAHTGQYSPTQNQGDNRSDWTYTKDITLKRHVRRCQCETTINKGRQC